MAADPRQTTLNLIIPFILCLSWLRM